jgi:hypothetical protein
MADSTQNANKINNNNNNNNNGEYKTQYNGESLKT